MSATSEAAETREAPTVEVHGDTQTTRIAQLFLKTAEYTDETKTNESQRIVRYKSIVNVPRGHTIQLCSFSFVGDKKEPVLGALLKNISFECQNDAIQSQLEPMTGNTLMIRNALTGVRATYDMGHNRTHVPLIAEALSVPLDSQPCLFAVTLDVVQLSQDDLKKMFTAKHNTDLFRDPELFVATISSETAMLPLTLPPNLRISPLCKFQKAIPFQTMNEHKNFTIPLKTYLDDMPRVRSIYQLWFHYSVLNIQTTSSMFDTLNVIRRWTQSTTYSGNEHQQRADVVHAYSSPVQLQILDKQMWSLFVSNPNARSAQEKYLTITLGQTSVSQAKELELQFNIHDQFFTDYSNWETEARDKLKEIKDAQIVVQFGFLFL